MHIGEKIKKFREEQNLTQAELARVAGIGQPYISKIEKQIISVPSPMVIGQIARGLNINVIELIENTSYAAESFEKFKEGIGYCPNAVCPGGNYQQFENTVRERISNRKGLDDLKFLNMEVDYYLSFHTEQVFPEWVPYKTSLVDTDGDSIHFCIYCGERLVTECWNCGRRIKGFYHYCPGCGKPVFRPLAGEGPESKGRRTSSIYDVRSDGLDSKSDDVPNDDDEDNHDK
jgi:XRE family transcriptional regulator, master regulator for biofilm formation